jgi:DNA-binding transcriptional MerR regulator
MIQKRYRTSEVARLAGVHPNTVRMYEQWGLIAPPPRTPAGYRIFSQAHIHQMRIARQVFRTTWAGGEFRRHAVAMVHHCAAGRLEEAHQEGILMLGAVEEERRQAELSAQYLERWVSEGTPQELPAPLLIGQAARLLDTTIDSLRSWERNGLIQVPRDSHSGYRLYSAREIGRLRVIRMLIRSGYSTMAVLRMVLQLDRGRRENLRDLLDTPRPDEDVLSASDHWLTSLAGLQEMAQQAVEMLEEFIESGAIAELED